MSCSCSCCRELLEGIRKKELLVGQEEEEEQRRTMDVCVLREQYRSSRERQRRLTQVLLFRTVSEELSEAVNIVPVAQGLTSPWEPNSTSSPTVTFDPDLKTYDPWRVHLELHRRSCLGVSIQLTPPSPEMPSSRKLWSPSSEAGGSQQESIVQKMDSLSDFLHSSRETSPCASLSSTNEEEEEEEKGGGGGEGEGEGDHISADRPRPDPESQSCDPGSSSSTRTDLDHPEILDDGSDERSTPVASITRSPSSASATGPHQDLEEHQSECQRTSSSSAAWRGSRKVLTRQLSIGSTSNNFYPFPSRRMPRISEAARRLGMYASF